MSERVTEQLPTRVVYVLTDDANAAFWDFQVGGMCASSSIWDWPSFRPVAVVDIGLLSLDQLNVQDIALMGEVPEGAKILWLAD